MAELWDWQQGLYEDTLHFFAQETTRDAEIRRAELAAAREALEKELRLAGVSPLDSVALADHWMDESRRFQAERLGWRAGVNKFKDNMASTGKAVGTVAVAAGTAIGALCPPAGIIVGLVGTALVIHGGIEETRVKEELKRRKVLSEKLHNAKAMGNLIYAEQAAQEYMALGGDADFVIVAGAEIDAGRFPVSTVVPGSPDADEGLDVDDVDTIFGSDEGTSDTIATGRPPPKNNGVPGDPAGTTFGPSKNSGGGGIWILLLLLWILAGEK